MGHTGRDAVLMRDGLMELKIKDLFAKKLATTAGIRMYYAVSRSHKRDTDYRHLVYLCLSNKVDPRAFIDWAFMMLAPRLPQSPAYIEALLHKYIAAQKPDIEYERTKVLIENMADRLKLMPSDADTMEFLLNPLNEFTCVFVYCAAYKLGLMDKIPPETVQCAKEEIFLKPVYLEKFSSIIPTEIMVDALTLTKNSDLNSEDS
jgi:hypothetical protein